MPKPEYIIISIEIIHHEWIQGGGGNAAQVYPLRLKIFPICTNVALFLYKESVFQRTVK